MARSKMAQSNFEKLFNKIKKFFTNLSRDDVYQLFGYNYNHEKEGLLIPFDNDYSFYLKLDNFDMIFGENDKIENSSELFFSAFNYIGNSSFLPK
jgi:hypothetical protein